MNPANMWSSTSSAQFKVECSGPSVAVTSTENLGRLVPECTAGRCRPPATSPACRAPVTCTVGPATSRSRPRSFPTRCRSPRTAPAASPAPPRTTSTTRPRQPQRTGADRQPDRRRSRSAARRRRRRGSAARRRSRSTGSEPHQLSGIASVSCQLDGGGWTTTDGARRERARSAAMACTRSAATATTGAGVKSPTESYTVQIDSAPPTVSFSTGPSQSTWSTTAQSIDVTATKPAGQLRRGGDQLHDQPADERLRQHRRDRQPDGEGHGAAAGRGSVLQGAGQRRELVDAAVAGTS